MPVRRIDHANLTCARNTASQLNLLSQRIQPIAVDPSDNGPCLNSRQSRRNPATPPADVV